MTRLRFGKVAFIAIMSVFFGGCALFGLSSSSESTKGKLGEGQSVCNTLPKSNIFHAYYQNTFKNIGSFVFGGQYTIAQVENLLGAQVYYIELNRSEKESVCAYIMATNTTYKQVKLTSQEIGQLESALAENDAYSEYERNDNIKDEYHTAMKFLKYHNKLAVPSNSLGLQSLRSLTKFLWEVDRIGSGLAARNIAITRFIHGKMQEDRVYKEGVLALVNTYTNIDSLNSPLKSACVYGKQPCHPLSNTECSSRLDEIRAIKNYAESVLK